MSVILIVDDSETLRQQLRRDLEAAHHTVIEAADGLDALRVFHSQPDIELILCDVNMPRLDGIGFCRRIKEDAATGELPIFMLTTESSAALKKAGKEAGVMAWITKPYGKNSLLAAINKVLSRHRAAV